ncbi:MAG: serine/threonine protein kinase, partial [Acidobacteriota bacterium]
MIGKSLGPYKILEPLGAGGMGEVYLGEDTRLGRKVAIKVLPAEFASDPERLARFEQEARAGAALNHPHIAVVHDVGSETGEDGSTTHFMVQEYLEGQSLRGRLDKGALPLDKTLDLATEVGEALIAAHKSGIIHRDLKPDNIFVTGDGHAKVLDFGLAKLTEGMALAGTSASMSPTMLGTIAGQVMGTAGYMAPEQIQGDVEVDRRADLFAFGCVLYEMVAGKRAFSGETVLDTLHAIARTEPQPLREIEPDLPAELHRILRKCLAKDTTRRYQVADEIVVDLRQLQDDIAAGVAIPVGGSEVTVASVAVETTRGTLWKMAAPIAVAIALLAVLTGWFMRSPLSPPPESIIRRFRIDYPPETAFLSLSTLGVAISPDGRSVVFNADSQLWLRAIDDLVAAPIRGTEGARVPFFSPDGQQLGCWGGDGQ